MKGLAPAPPPSTPVTHFIIMGTPGGRSFSKDDAFCNKIAPQNKQDYFIVSAVRARAQR